MSEQIFVKISLFFFFFFIFFFVILHNLQKSPQLVYACSNLAEIGTRIGGIKANIRSNFEVNLSNIQGVITVFTHTAKSNFCHAYRVNCFKQKAENWYVARLNISGMPFVVIM